MKILLHICCAVCASSCVERLRQQGHEPTGYFYNPNIHPQAEYRKRLQEIEKLAERESFALIVGNYETNKWFSRIKGLELEPEGGRRCLNCFRLRLDETAKVAREKGFVCFTTSLSVSPHKHTPAINEIGRSLDRKLFLECDFKKQDGFKRARELAKQYNLYHQDYCGCIFSLEERRNYGRILQKTRAVRHQDQAAQD